MPPGVFRVFLWQCRLLLWLRLRCRPLRRAGHMVPFVANCTNRLHRFISLKWHRYDMLKRQITQNLGAILKSQARIRIVFIFFQRYGICMYRYISVCIYVAILIYLCVDIWSIICYTIYSEVYDWMVMCI